MKVRKTISITEETLKKVEEIARQNSRNFSNFIEHLCQLEIKKNDKNGK